MMYSEVTSPPLGRHLFLAYIVRLFFFFNRLQKRQFKSFLLFNFYIIAHFPHSVLMEIMLCTYQKRPLTWTTDYLFGFWGGGNKPVVWLKLKCQKQSMVMALRRHRYTLKIRQKKTRDEAKEPGKAGSRPISYKLRGFHKPYWEFNPTGSCSAFPMIATALRASIP